MGIRLSVLAACVAAAVGTYFIGNTAKEDKFSAAEYILLFLTLVCLVGFFVLAGEAPMGGKTILAVLFVIFGLSFLGVRFIA